MQRASGYILTGRDVRRDGPYPARWPLQRPPLPMETSIPGVFAAGDARYRSIKRVASAVGDGAAAVRLAHEYLSADRADQLAEVSGERTDPLGPVAGDGTGPDLVARDRADQSIGARLMGPG